MIQNYYLHKLNNYIFFLLTNLSFINNYLWFGSSKDDKKREKEFRIENDCDNVVCLLEMRNLEYDKSHRSLWFLYHWFDWIPNWFLFWIRSIR